MVGLFRNGKATSVKCVLSRPAAPLATKGPGLRCIAYLNKNHRIILLLINSIAQNNDQSEC